MAAIFRRGSSELVTIAVTMRVLLFAVMCVSYEVVQGFPRLCDLRDFKLNENKKGANGCIVDVCDGGIFKSHECTKLKNDGRCNPEDLQHERRKAACQCCNLVAVMQLPQLMLG